METTLKMPKQEKKENQGLKILKMQRAELKDLLKKENLIPFNRSITPIHVRKMVDSIKACGLLRLPIIGKLNYYAKPKYRIIDGQHLLKAVTGMNPNKFAEIDCIIKEYENKSEVIFDIAKLNDTQKSWSDSDYLNAWYKFGPDNVKHFTHYSYLHMQFKNSKLPCGFVIDLYAVDKERFKLGKLELKDREFSDQILSVAIMLKDDYNKSVFAMYGLLEWANNRKYKEKKETDFEKLISRLRMAFKNKEDIAISNDRTSFNDFFERIYTRV